MGLQTCEFSKVIIDTYNLPLTWQEYSQLQKEKAKKLMANVQLMPGILLIILN